MQKRIRAKNCEAILKGDTAGGSVKPSLYYDPRVSGIDWNYYKHPLPEHVNDVYISYWQDVNFNVYAPSLVRNQIHSNQELSTCSNSSFNADSRRFELYDPTMTAEPLHFC